MSCEALYHFQCNIIQLFALRTQLFAAVFANERHFTLDKFCLSKALAFGDFVTLWQNRNMDFQLSQKCLTVSSSLSSTEVFTGQHSLSGCSCWQCWWSLQENIKYTVAAGQATCITRGNNAEIRALHSVCRDLGKRQCSVF